MTPRRRVGLPADEQALQLAHELAIAHLLLHADYPCRCQLAFDLARLAGRSGSVRSLAARLLMDWRRDDLAAAHREVIVQVDAWCDRHRVGHDGRYLAR
jgi:hypothetical protein